jgi:hypothetical protein
MIVQNEDVIEYLKTIENTTTAENVIDKRVIYPNAWYIYGCGKPDDKNNIYKVSKTYKIVKKGTEDIQQGTC